MYCEVSYIYAEEDKALQLGKVIVPQFEIVYYNARFALEDRHRPGYVNGICELAKYVQTVLLDHALTWWDLVEGGTLKAVTLRYGEHNPPARG